jgi:hypothetical protein
MCFDYCIICGHGGNDVRMATEQELPGSTSFPICAACRTRQDSTKEGRSNSDVSPSTPATKHEFDCLCEKCVSASLSAARTRAVGEQ